MNKTVKTEFAFVNKGYVKQFFPQSCLNPFDIEYVHLCENLNYVDYFDYFCYVPFGCKCVYGKQGSNMC